MKSKFIIVKNETWQPSSFYDSQTQLIWVMEYKLFRNVCANKSTPPEGYKYAIHKDVYAAFLHKYKNGKSIRKTRKLRRNNK